MKLFAVILGTTFGCKGNAQDDGSGVVSGRQFPSFALQRPPPGVKPLPERKPAPSDDFHHQKLKNKIRKLIDSKMRDARNGKRIDIMSRKVTEQIEGLFQL